MPDRASREPHILLAETSVHITADHARLLEDPITEPGHLTTDEFVANLVYMLTGALFAPVPWSPPLRRSPSRARRRPRWRGVSQGLTAPPESGGSGARAPVGDNGAVIPVLALQRISSVSPLAYVLAFGGGVISFLSPCVLPLVPGYLSLVTGLDLVTLREGSRRYQGEIAVTTGLFVLGFGIVFVLLGLSASAVGSTLVHHQDVLTRVSGAVMLGVRALPRRLRVPARAVAVRRAPLPSAGDALRTRRRPSSQARPSPSAGRRASGRCWVRSSRSRPTRTARGPAPRCSRRTRSASACRSSSAGSRSGRLTGALGVGEAPPAGDRGRLSPSSSGCSACCCCSTS